MSIENSALNTADLIMYNAETSQLGWYYQYSCSTSCNPATSNIYISQENQVIVVGLYHNNFPRIFEVSLTDGSLRNAGVESSVTLAGVEKPIMEQFGPSDTQLVISYPYTSNGTFIVWSTNTSSVIISFNGNPEAKPFTAIAGSHSKGMLYYFREAGNPTTAFTKFYFNDPSVASFFLSGSLTLNQQSSVNLASATVSISSSSFPSSTDLTVAISNVSITTQANISTDIVYTNGENQFHYVASGYSGNLSFDYF